MVASNRHNGLVAQGGGLTSTPPLVSKWPGCVHARTTSVRGGMHTNEDEGVVILRLLLFEARPRPRPRKWEM